LKTISKVRCDDCGWKGKCGGGVRDRMHVLWNWRRGSSAIGLHMDGREVISIFVLDETFH
jgi:hypothetical protein